MKKSKKKVSLIKKILGSKRVVVTTLVSLIVLILLGLLVSKTNLRRLLSSVDNSEKINSKEIEYDNKDGEMESSNMQDAIDELYGKCLKLKDQCPDGYKCISNDDIDAKNALKESIKSAEEKLSELEDEEEIEKISSKIGEAKGAIYNDDYDKIKSIKSELDELL